LVLRFQAIHWRVSAATGQLCDHGYSKFVYCATGCLRATGDGRKNYFPLERDFSRFGRRKRHFASIDRLVGSECAVQVNTVVSCNIYEARALYNVHIQHDDVSAGIILIDGGCALISESPGQARI
jgi:hypothetical protein